MQTPELNLCGYYNSKLASPEQTVSEVRNVYEYEIEYVLADGCICNINGVVHNVQADSIIVAKPGTKRFSDYQKPLVTIYLRVNADDIVKECLESLPDYFPLLRSSQAKLLMSDIVTNFNSDKKDELYISGKLLLLISLLYEDSSVKNGKLAGLYPRMHKAKKFIENHFSQPIKTEDIAESIFMSESHFRARFRELYGITPHDYLIAVRLEEAKKLLSNSTYSCSEIAALCHLGSQKNFSTLFRQKTGISPSNYRKLVMNRYAN